MSPEQIKDKLAPILTGPRILPDADYNVLRVCPFCGNEPNPKPAGRVYGYAIECFCCEFTGPWGDTPELAVYAWNTRAK